MTLRPSARAIAFAAAILSTSAAMAGPAIDVVKGAGCGCCVAWIERLEQAGFEVSATDVSQGELTKAKIAAGLTPELASCHTARIGGYVVEGHVPAREIDRLMSEKPDAIGLAVPGMPLGSPGMDFGDEAQPYDVLLVRKDGTTEVFASYPGR